MRKTPFYVMLLAFVALSLVLSACQSSQPEATTSPVQPTTTPAGDSYPAPGPGDAAYPEPVYTVDPNYPAPESVNPVAPTPMPTQDPALGSAKGVLLNAGNPEKEAQLYLAAVVKDASGRELVASYSRADAPYAVSDAQGVFRFVNLQPGKYGLVLDRVVNAYLLNYPGEENKPVLFVVEAGKETDIGELGYDSMPKQ